MRRALVVAAVAGTVVLAGCVGGLPSDVDTGAEPTDSAPSGPVPDGELEVHHIDVGQADATLIVTPAGETILVDSGDWRDDGETVIDYLDARGVDRIDHLVATHGHADHIGGHAAVIDHYETEREGVGAVYDSGVAHTSQTYENYLDAVERHDLDLFTVAAGDELPLDDGTVSVTVLNPAPGADGDDLHANSVALAVEFGEFGYLTTGDAETEVEHRLAEDHAGRLDVDVYQAGHHGSSTSSSDRLLDTASPQVAIVSSDFDSRYGHPHDEVLQRFADRDVATYWTGVHGDVVVTTDGETASVETAQDGPTDPLELLAMKPAGDDADSIAPEPTDPALPLHG